MKVIVGLGNPGEKYHKTRHNIGFMALDFYVESKMETFRKQNDVEISSFGQGVEKVILIKPQTFMNLSGQAVRKIVDYYKCDVDDILVIYDDLDTDFGKLKIKYDSGSGGHNGIKDIIQKLATKKFLKLKLGIKNSHLKEARNFVLSDFNKDEKQSLIQIFELTNKIIDDFVRGETKIDLMNKYNGG